MRIFEDIEGREIRIPMCVAYRKDSEDERILALVDRLCPDGGKTEGKPDVPRPASRMAAVGPWSPAGVLAACAVAGAAYEALRQQGWPGLV